MHLNEGLIKEIICYPYVGLLCCPEKSYFRTDFKGIREMFMSD